MLQGLVLPKFSAQISLVIAAGCYALSGCGTTASNASATFSSSTNVVAKSSDLFAAFHEAITTGLANGDKIDLAAAIAHLSAESFAKICQDLNAVASASAVTIDGAQFPPARVILAGSRVSAVGFGAKYATLGAYLSAANVNLSAALPNLTEAQFAAGIRELAASAAPSVTVKQSARPSSLSLDFEQSADYTQTNFFHADKYKEQITQGVGVGLAGYLMCKLGYETYCSVAAAGVKSAGATDEPND